MIIKNKKQLATTEIRRIALEIIEAGITRVLPSTVMKTAITFDNVRRKLHVNSDIFSVSNGRIFVIGGGKASGLMSESLENILGTDNITDGIVICKGSGVKTNKIKLVHAGHPIPDKRGVAGVRHILQLKDQYSICRDDLILCLISGGGSALMPYPANGITLDDKIKTTEILLASGAAINEINTVRKHLSKIKGGRLGQFYSPATVISLILSDVIGNDLSVIASGPTFPDSSTFEDALDVLKRYRLVSETPAGVLELLEKGRLGLIEETPRVLDNCFNYIIGDNSLALQAMAQKARELGFHPHIISDEQKGDTKTTADCRATEIINLKNTGYDVFLLGGETTLKLPEKAGKGGRNQHYAAASLLAMKGCEDEWAMASIGSDGSDFLADVAGAIIDSTSLGCLHSKKIDVEPFLATCDSNTLLNTLGNSIVVTGNTETNVGDLIVYILNRSPRTQE